MIGALPITAVVARSSANVQAGAKTRISRTLHGLWLLAFALLLPQVLARTPSVSADLVRRHRHRLVVQAPPRLQVEALLE